MAIDDNNAYLEIKESLIEIKQYLETGISKETELKIFKIQLEKAQQSIEGNRQIINKLLGDLSKLQNDIDWYKRTYENRSFLGTMREKIWKKIAKYF